jgi:hypothetical protein
LACQYERYLFCITSEGEQWRLHEELIDSQATRTKVANAVYCSKVVSESVGIGATGNMKSDFGDDGDGNGSDRIKHKLL